jgi:imidazolonepropionase
VIEVMKMGTGAIEIKSGYGLNVDDELKMLRVIRWIRETAPVCVRATFLGAHAIPDEYRKNKTKYVDLVTNEMIQQLAAEELADLLTFFATKAFFRWKIPNGF